jgi:hypothetical protein
MPRSPRRVARLALVLGAIIVAALTLARPAAASSPPGTVTLSNGVTITRWANPATQAPVYRRPSPGAPTTTVLHRLTEDRFPEVYLVLGRWTAPDGQAWLRIRLPMRPNGATGWVRDRDLGELHTVNTELTINRRTLRAALYRDGHRIWVSRVGVGKPSTPTPAGRFWIREKFPIRGAGGFYGPWALGTSAYSRLSEWPGGGVVGIHGTNHPALVPGRPSHGCVRVRNVAIRRLAHLIPIGTPLRVR